MDVCSESLYININRIFFKGEVLHLSLGQLFLLQLIGAFAGVFVRDFIIGPPLAKK